MSNEKPGKPIKSKAKAKAKPNGITAESPPKQNRQGRLKMTPEKEANFVRLLSECGNVTKSAQGIGMTARYLYEYRKTHPEFLAQWEEAAEGAMDRLEQEAYRRAFAGVDEPVFHRGEVCGTVKKYSDTLLIFLLKGGKPEKYQERNTTKHEVGEGLREILDLVNGKGLPIPKSAADAETD